MNSVGIHRPRNLDWRRAAALLYGDWGTSKAYVIGLAFVAAAYSSLPIIVAVCLLTAVVGYNYTVVCKHFPDGGGVYSAARRQSRLLAVMGALLLVADLTVTAAMSAWAAMGYFGVPKEHIRWATMTLIAIVGLFNFFGPKHSGSLALTLAVPMVFVVTLIIGWSIPYLTFSHLEPSHESLGKNWIAFVGVILTLSGVEAIANLTGVMKLDRGATMDKPRVAVTARKSIIPVAIEVVLGTSVLGWAMLSMPQSMADQMHQRWEDMVRFLGEFYGGLAYGQSFGTVFGVVVGVVVGLLLLSAVNTAVAALIGLLYSLARDGEMPRALAKLNPFGVPWWPMALAAIMPFIVVATTSGLEGLAGLYAIGVVGAITVNLGSCAFSTTLPIRWFERGLMGITFIVLFLVELTIAKTKPDALFFAVCVLGLGLGLRSYAQRRAGLRTLTVSQQVAAAIAPELSVDFQIKFSPGQSIMVAARGITPVLGFALEEARLRQGMLYVLYVKEVALAFPGYLPNAEPPRWQNDYMAARIMSGMLEQGRQNDVTVVPLYAVSDNPAATILDLAATLGIDILMLGASHRRSLVSILKGDVVTEVARTLPDTIHLVIHG